MITHKTKPLSIIVILLILVGLLLPSGVSASTKTAGMALLEQNSAKDLLSQGCTAISVTRFFAQGDDLFMTVRNEGALPFSMTSSTLIWSLLLPDGSHNPGGHVDWFTFNNNRYYNGDSYTSPTQVNPVPPVQFPGLSTADWRVDFDNGYPLLTLGAPTTVHLTFEPIDGTGSCMVSGTLYPIDAELIHPENDDLVLAHRTQTRFEAEAWEQVMGGENGDGIRRVRFRIFDAQENSVFSHAEYIPPYCAFGEKIKCNPMSKELWNSLGSGSYKLEVSAEGVNGIWSKLYVQPFVIQK